MFNYVATYNDFERRFAQFLDKANDVVRFASLGTTEQGEAGTQFRVDYLKPSGAIGFYYPDWVVVQKTDTGEVNWIIETKGRVWEGTQAKDEAMKTWCKRVSEDTGMVLRYARINQSEFDRATASELGGLVKETLIKSTGSGSRRNPISQNQWVAEHGSTANEINRRFLKTDSACSTVSDEISYSSL